MKILGTNLTLKAKEILKNAQMEIIEEQVSQSKLINFVEEHFIEGIIFDTLEHFNSDIIDACPHIKLIAFKEEIEENSDIQFAKDQGIHIIDIQESTATSKAELCIAHLTGMVRFLHQSNREMPLEGDMNFENLHHNFIGTELKGKTLGIIGINSVCKELVRISIGLGMKPLITDHEPKNLSVPVEFFDGQTIDFQLEYSDFNELISQSDFLIINTSGNGVYIIDDYHFEKMKKGVGIISISKGGVNEIALINAIENKKVMFAGLDVFENQPNPEIQLLMNPELSLSPNLSSQTYEAQIKISEELANAIVDVMN